MAYIGRILSEQIGKEAKKSYKELKKVYSIWIMPYASKYKDGAIYEQNVNINAIKPFSPRKNKKRQKKDMDKFNIIEVYIGKKHNYDQFFEVYDTLLTPLYILLTNHFNAEEKVKILEEYGLPFDEEIESEVNNVCNLSEVIFKQGIQQGIEQGIQKERLVSEQKRLETLVESVRNVMEEFQCSLSKALDVLVKNEADRKYVLEKVSL